MIGEIAGRLIRWLVRKIGGDTLISLSLLLLIVGSTVWGLVGVSRELDRRAFLWIAAFGLVMGWALARTRIRGWLAGLLTITLGLIFLTIQVGQLASPLLVLLDRLAQFCWQVLRGHWRPLPDADPLLQSLRSVGSLAVWALARAFGWLQSLISGEAAFDPLAVALAWGMAVWAVSAWASWALRRSDHAWLAILPAGILLAGTLNYVGGETLTLAPMLAGTLLLTAFTRYNGRQRKWDKTTTDYSEGLRNETLLAALVLTALITLVALFSPMISVRKIAGYIRERINAHTAQSEQVADSLGLITQYQMTSAFGRLSDPGLPREHLLGSGQELSRQLAMVVQLIDPPHPSLTNPNLEPPRYYWRNLTYDIYTGHGWMTSIMQLTDYPAGETARQPTSPAQYTVRQRIQLIRGPSPISGQATENLVYSTGELFSVNRDYRVTWRSPNDAFGASVAASNYEAISGLTIASEAGLRAAGERYPAWVTERYLGLPESVPERVRRLATELTAAAPTPYDRARALETYLRTFPYALDLPLPPADQDVSHYFLFDLKKGYCDYYATAMAVLARAVGIPARLVTGYATGRYDATTDQFVVTEADAHSWVEIYFPGYGWVEFEPTGGRPAIVRSHETTSAERTAAGAPIEPAALIGDQLPTVEWPTLIGGVLLIGALILLGRSFNDHRRLRKISPSAAVITLYRRFHRLGQRLTVSTRPSDTPYEFSERLAERLIRFTQGRRLANLLSPAVPDIHLLVDLYVRTVFSPHPPIQSDQFRAIQLWDRLRWRLRWVRLAQIRREKV